MGTEPELLKPGGTLPPPRDVTDSGPELPSLGGTQLEPWVYRKSQGLVSRREDAERPTGDQPLSRRAYAQ